MQGREQLLALSSDLHLWVIRAFGVSLELRALYGHVPLHFCTPLICSTLWSICTAGTRQRVTGLHPSNCTEIRQRVLKPEHLVEVIPPGFGGTGTMDRPARSWVGPRSGFPIVTILIGTANTSRGWNVLAPADALARLLLYRELVDENHDAGLWMLSIVRCSPGTM